jgi:hypothetical protein
MEPAEQLKQLSEEAQHSIKEDMVSTSYGRRQLEHNIDQAEGVAEFNWRIANFMLESFDKVDAVKPHLTTLEGKAALKALENHLNLMYCNMTGTISGRKQIKQRDAQRAEWRPLAQERDRYRKEVWGL